MKKRLLAVEAACPAGPDSRRRANVPELMEALQITVRNREVE